MSTEKQPPQPAANDEIDALTTLKTLLLGTEQSSIEQLQADTRDPVVQAKRVAESLPHSLHKAYEASPTELTRALEAPVSECIETSVKHNPTLFADILYPVMGPAIRRSISQALKGLVQQINQTLEHSLTIKGLSWRLQAARSGVPFAEIVLRNTLRYRVEEVFLIQSGSGLLVQHLSQGPARAQDADAVSAMLTAIRDFAHDTLDREGDESRLETVDVGDHTLWLIHGPVAYLACAIRGIPPVVLRDELQTVLEQIHRRHTALLKRFDGDEAEAAVLAPLLERCLQSEASTTVGRRFPWPLLLLLAGIIGSLAWWGYGKWQARTLTADHQAQQNAAVARLAASPGIVLTDWQIIDGRLVLRGLHDPVTPSPQDVLAEAGLATDSYSLNFHAFQSADPVAALARAGRRLEPPESITLALNASGTLQAQGYASSSWMNRAAILATTVPGVEHYDDTLVESADERILRQLIKHLQAPASVSITVQDGVAVLSGQAPLSWINSLAPAPPEIAGLSAMHREQLLPLEQQRLRELIELIEQSSVEFVDGIDLDAAQLARIETLAGLISEAHHHAQDLGRPMRLQIIGRTDGTGSQELNHFIARERAAKVAQVLLSSSYDMPEINLRAQILPIRRAETELALRRVEFRVLDPGEPQLEQR